MELVRILLSLAETSEPFVTLGDRTVRGVLLTIAAVLATFATAEARDIESRQAIEAVARGFLEQALAEQGMEGRVSVDELDQRLRLTACEEPLEGFQPPGGRLLGNTTVGVRCAAPKAWSIYVQAKVEVIEEVLVSAVPLSRGTIVSRDDLRFDTRDTARLTTGYITDLTDVVGKRLKRSVRAGMPLNPQLLELPEAIKRGERVSILARGGGLEVRMEGKALEDGAPGQVIRVRNLSSERVIEAEVTGPGIVEVRM